MEVLGIGMPELVFILIIALLILGPKDMQKAGRTVGVFLRKIAMSDGWKAFLQTSRELRTLPNRLMREANEELNKIGNDLNASDSAGGHQLSIKSPQRPGTNPQSIPTTSTPGANNPPAAPKQDETSSDSPKTNA